MHTMDHYRLSRLLDTLKDRPPNLDAMTADELLNFYLTHQGGYQAQLLFRKGGSPSQRATDLLAHYADCKRQAIACRREGNVEAARGWETRCEETYALLPQFARWRSKPKKSTGAGGLAGLATGFSRRAGPAV